MMDEGAASAGVVTMLTDAAGPAAVAAPLAQSSDWAVVAVALISGFFAWLATWVTNRRAAKADRTEVETPPAQPSFGLDIRDGVMALGHRVERVEERQDAMHETLRDIAKTLHEINIGRRLH
jgi:hypothetical protein